MDTEDLIINGSLIQFSKLCKRLYLKHLRAEHVYKTIVKLDLLAKEHGLSKIIAKVPSTSKELFLDNGYKIEAYIPGFYQNEIDMYFMGKFLTKERALCHNKDNIEDVLEKSHEKLDTSQKCNLDNSCHKKIESSEIQDLVKLFEKIFETYPTPIFDENYILESMQKNNDYIGIWQNEKLVAAAELEKDFPAQNAELAAFAVLPDYRGKSFSICLIEELEKVLKEQNFKTAYAIARAESYGMNISFAKMNYTYAGTLVNNTCIGGNLEHMHVWYKKI